MDKLINVLQKALQLEQDGYDYYNKMVSKSKNRLVKNLFKSLAREEKVHYLRIKAIVGSLITGKKILKKDMLLGKLEGRIFDEIFTKYEDDKEYKAEIVVHKRSTSQNVPFWGHRRNSSDRSSYMKFRTPLWRKKNGN